MKSALRNTSRFDFAGVPNALNSEPKRLRLLEFALVFASWRVCCIAVGRISLLHCAWLVVRVGVLCCIVVGGRLPSSFSLSLSVVAHFSAIHDIHQVPQHSAVLKSPPARDALRLGRLKRSRIALFIWGLGLRRRPTAHGFLSAQRYETNDAR